MKKILTLIAFVVSSLSAMAYTDNLVIDVDGEKLEVPNSVVLIENTGENLYKFVMKDFQMEAIKMGDVTVENVPGVTVNGITTIKVIQIPVHIGNSMWASLLSDVTVNVSATFNEEKLYAVVEIDLTEQLEQMVIGTFGQEDYFDMSYPQLLNGGFEDWGVDAENGADKASEPRYWHSFSSASGSLVALTGDHCFISTDAHSGKYSASIKASQIFGIVANGTLTTGRLNADALSAADTKNHSELDMSKTELDRNNNPFYQILNARPDSIAFWVKYSTGKEGTLANMSAYITDGTYYQAPEEKTYENKVAVAENPNIAPCTEWTRISVPFTYLNEELKSRGILVTFSTCATPGGGAGDEVLLVDDVELIYKGREDSAGIIAFDYSSDKENTSPVIYDLQGCRHNTLQPGINIVNGKKIIVK